MRFLGIGDNCDLAALYLDLAAHGLAIDPSDEHGRRLEGHDPARGDRRFHACPGIAPDPPALRADVETAEGPRFHRLAPLQRLA